VSWVYKLLKQRRDTGSAAPKPRRGGFASAFDARAREALRGLVAERPDATLAELRDRLAGRGGPRRAGGERGTGVPGAQGPGPAAQKKTRVADERQRPDVMAAREAWGREVLAAAAQWAARLVFVDESFATTAMARLYARAPRGERAFGGVPAGRWQVTTLVGAVRLDGLCAAMTVEGAADADADADVFRAFVGHALAPSLRPGDVVVMDNLSSHKAAGVREMIEAAGATLRYLPAYSPDLNPIEMMWSKVKQKLRDAAARTSEALEAAIAEALAAVSAADCLGWFNHCGYSPQ
jgi:transposase